MIKLKNLNKYYNYKKRNQIHVTNNISLELPRTGLICLLGPSGSGKTTLLNIIGGLDDLNSGTINIAGDEINKYNEKTWNYYRNYKFGYIFQNYLLLNDLSVYENLEFSLKSYDLPSTIVDERIKYALKAVGMEKYIHRKPTELSGGQQQRVSIARALIKSPEVYIVDEPTGNIDEKNTTLIMNILKKISKKSCVILVTHETRLADFYGDRIIELKDGRVVADYQNKSTNAFDKHDDNNIYLQEYTNASTLIKDIDINYFYQDEVNTGGLKLKIVKQDNTYYIQAEPGTAKVKYLEKDDEIKIFDSKKPILRIQDVEKTEFSLAKLEINKTKPIFKFKDVLKKAFNSLKNLKIIHKVMIFIFFLASIFITYGLATYNASFYVDEKIFLDYNRELLEISGESNLNKVDLTILKNTLETDYLLVNSYYSRLPNLVVSEFYQRPGSVYLEKGDIFPLDKVANIKLIAGRLPTTPYELLIDSYLAEEMLNLREVKNRGINRPEQFIGTIYEGRGGLYNVVGIIDNNNPNFYLTKEGYQIYALNSSFETPYSLGNITSLKDSIVLYDDVDVLLYILNDEFMNREDKLKDLELADNEILVSSFLDNNLKEQEITLNNKNYKIVGRYITKNPRELSIYIQEHQLDELYDTVLLGHRALRFPSKDKDLDLKTLENRGYQVNDLYANDYQDNVILEKDSQLLLYASLVILLMFVFLYLVMRSSVTSQIYTIGVYRALGVGKLSVLKIFLTEIILISFVSVFLGIALLSIGIRSINSITPFLYYPWYVPLSTFLSILVMNSIIGMLPLIPYLRQTPAQVLSRFDS